MTGTSALVGVLAGLVAAAIWGGWPVVSQYSVADSLTVYDINALRFAVSGLILLPIVWKRGLGGLHPVKALLLSCGAGAPYGVVAILGLTFAPAGHAGIIIPSCMLLFTSIAGWLLLSDRPSGTRMVGLAIIIVGVLMTGWDGLLAGMDFGPRVWLGDLLFVGAGFLWATYTVGARAWSVDAIHATALVAVISMILYLPLYALFAPSNLFAAPLPALVLQGAYQGIGTGILALLFYTVAVRHLGASRGALFAALVPASAAALGIPILGLIPTGLQVAGIVVVTIGMVAALTSGSSVSRQKTEVHPAETGA